MASNEVCDVLDVSQFLPGRSAYECVAYAAALLKYAGMPGQGPTGSVLQASNLAQFWYGREEGSNGAANMNGMSLQAEYNMLTGMGLSYRVEELQDASYNEQLINLCLREGTPCLICGAETGFYDMALGDRVPYNWTPTGNHAIVVSGIAPDGNFLVHDTANVDAQGNVRAGPRTYDASKMQIVSVTAVQIGEITVININTPGVGNYFTESGTAWACKQTGKVIQDAILAFYQQDGNAALCGLTSLGLPVSNEISIAAGGIVKQYFERGVLFYDPQHAIDSPPGAGSVYTAHLYQGAGEDPKIAELTAEIITLQAQAAPPQAYAAMLQSADILAGALGKKVV